MSEVPASDEAVQASLAGLRASGAWQADAARLFALEALARRLSSQPPAVQQVLRGKLEAEVAAYARRVGAAPPIAKQPLAATRCAPLAELNDALRASVAARAGAPAPGEPAPDPDELPSARRFRQAWGRNRTLEQFDRAVSRKPANAGPLNSHKLVLQSLDMMRGVSTDYLRRFIAHVETLQWLEEAVAAAAKEQARPRPARKARARK